MRAAIGRLIAAVGPSIEERTHRADLERTLAGEHLIVTVEKIAINRRRDRFYRELNDAKTKQIAEDWKQHSPGEKGLHVHLTERENHPRGAS